MKKKSLFVLRSNIEYRSVSIILVYSAIFRNPFTNLWCNGHKSAGCPELSWVFLTISNTLNINFEVSEITSVLILGKTPVVTGVSL